MRGATNPGPRFKYTARCHLRNLMAMACVEEVTHQTAPPADAGASLEACRRSAWFPVVTDGDVGGAAASKFSGTPELADGEAWPRCGSCGKCMQMFVQLKLAELPEAVRHEFGSGLLQMFYCTSSERDGELECGSWMPFANSTLVRILPDRSQGRAGAGTTIPEEIQGFFPPSTIVGWTEVADYPGVEEWEDYMQNLEKWQEWELLFRERNMSGTKLGGWPCWVQSVEYPSCPVCHQTMRFVFQIDSNDKVPYMFGDMGCGHITQCPTHQGQLAFAWACC